MEFFQNFIIVFIAYWKEIFIPLALGFFFSGIFHQFIPTKFVEDHLGDKGFKPILIAAFVGIILPVCCVGALPIAMTLKRKGARLGAILAFLVATPATSVTALFVCWQLLGISFTLNIFIAVSLMAIVLGFISNDIRVDLRQSKEKKDDCCSDDGGKTIVQKTFIHKFTDALKFAFITLPKEIGLEIVIGIAVASAITIFEPFHQFIAEHLTGLMGYFFILVTGLITYVCSTASVPLADAFIQSGMSHGQALCYLLVGPVTSYSVILVIKKEFGWNVLTLYLSVLCIFSLIYGLCWDMLLSS